jgi:hypothetical protein
MKKHIVIAIVLVGIVALLMILLPGKTDPMDRLKLAVGYGLAILIFLYGFVILMGLASGEIDISDLLSESGSDCDQGKASMSRFQLLIFTFVIAMSLFFIVVKTNGFPPVPSEILTLLGISATTYGVSKGIQASSNGTSSTDSSDTTTTTTTATTTTAQPTTTATTTTQGPTTTANP